MSGSVKKKLRIITYMFPGLPFDLFETLLKYLESVTGMDAYLITESRWSGPPPERDDPFTADEVDIGIMCSTYFLSMVDNKNPYIELCEAAPLHEHKDSLNRPVYFSDVLVHAEKASQYKTFHDLKGCRWAYNDDLSLSGNLVALAELKKLGFDSSFFGSVIQSGGHFKSLKMIMERKVDAAAIDTNCWNTFLYMYPEKKSLFHCVTTLGPMPVYPIVFNKRMPSELKDKITKALLDVKNSPEYGPKLRKIGVLGYVPVDMSTYSKETEIRDLVKGLKINAAYY